ncbi:MAG TPA: response regulator, partial [Planctomycetota bacterium]|nr:response regulator [Planctomycetota bacterium]
SAAGRARRANYRTARKIACVRGGCTAVKMVSRVAVVDGEACARRSMPRTIERKGVFEAASVERAIESIARATPDLILLGRRVCDRSGVEVLEALRRADIPVPS